MKATLISWTLLPVETTLAVWDASKGEQPLDEIKERLFNNPLGEADHSLFERILEQEIPVGQFVSFAFVLEDVPVSWREQAVRHRVGVSYGANYAVDMFPSEGVSFWSQSMRIQSMEHFAQDGKYHIPDSVMETVGAPGIYMEAMERIEEAYAHLVRLGIPMEDARNLIPLGATHRIAMTINLQSLRHIIGERGCWILQASLWAPVIKSMVDELCTKVSPVFRKLVAPPCVKNDQFKGCVYHEENRRRATGEDKMQMCPLWYGQNAPLVPHPPASAFWTKERVDQYQDLWGHTIDPVMLRW